MANYTAKKIDATNSSMRPALRESGLAAMNQWKQTVALEVQRVQSGPKPTKARKQFSAHSFWQLRWAAQGVSLRKPKQWTTYDAAVVHPPIVKLLRAYA